MARSRNIKPGFFANDVLAECSAMARLLFIGMWGIADREGRLEDRPRRIKGQVFPYDNCEIEELLAELTDRGFVVAYEVDGRKLLYIPNFRKHQNPHKNEPQSTIPPPPSNGASSTVLVPESHASAPEELGIRKEERGMMNQELGIAEVPEIPNSGDVSGNGGKMVLSLTEDELDEATDRAIAYKRKVPTKSQAEALALCRVAALEIRCVGTHVIEGALEKTCQKRRGTDYLTKALLGACSDLGNDLNETFRSIVFPPERVRQVLEAQVHHRR